MELRDESGAAPALPTGDGALDQQRALQVARRTGRKAVVDPHPHQALELLAVQFLPPGTRKVGSPSLRPAKREMVLRVAGLEGQAYTERFERSPHAPPSRPAIRQGQVCARARRRRRHLRLGVLNYAVSCLSRI